MTLVEALADIVFPVRAPIVRHGTSYLVHRTGHYNNPTALYRITIRSHLSSAMYRTTPCRASSAMSGRELHRYA
jgi:hypothetical protein